MIQALISFGLLLVAGNGWAAGFKVGLVFDQAGKDDLSFNSAAYQGAMNASRRLGVIVEYAVATQDDAVEPALRHFAKKDFDLIIGIGHAQAEAIRKTALQFPRKQFAIVDTEVKAPNVRSLLFAEHEGSYLVGAIAAATSKTGKIGFLGGMDIPLIHRFEAGYTAGAKKIRPDVIVISGFLGDTADAWTNPAKAKEVALEQYASGVDVIFAAAGASNQGLFEAAEQLSRFAIGVDSNQNGIKPGRILTSMLKRVDVAVFGTIRDATNGYLNGGVRRFGLAQQGVDYAMDQHNRGLLSKEVIAKVEGLRKQILENKIRVPDSLSKK